MNMTTSANSCNKPLSFCDCIENIDILENEWTRQTMQVRDSKSSEGIKNGELHLLGFSTFQSFLLQVQRRKNRAFINSLRLLWEVACLLFQYIGAKDCQGRVVLMPLPGRIYSFLLLHSVVLHMT